MHLIVKAISHTIVHMNCLVSNLDRFLDDFLDACQKLFALLGRDLC